MSLVKIEKLIREVKRDKRIDTHAWKEFNLVDVFPNYAHGQRLTKADRIAGDIPLVTAGQYNNGVAQYVKSNSRNVIFENCVTIDMFGNSFYQEGKFICDDNVYPIKNVRNKYVGLFLASVFKKQINFDFKKQFRLKHLVNIKMKFPVNNEGEPDWRYMEKYIHNLYRSYKKLNLKKIEKLHKEIMNEKKITYSHWKRFPLITLFEYKRGRRYKRGDHKTGSIAYVSSSAKNNGVDNFVNPPQSLKIYKNCITIANSGSVGSCFYHDYEFVASDHVHVLSLIGKQLTKNTALFLVAALEKNKDKFMFNKEISEDTIKDIEIVLPVDKQGEPDWKYIENYISNVFKSMKTGIES